MKFANLIQLEFMEGTTAPALDPTDDGCQVHRDLGVSDTGPAAMAALESLRQHDLIVVLTVVMFIVYNKTI